MATVSDFAAFPIVANMITYKDSDTLPKQINDQCKNHFHGKLDQYEIERDEVLLGLKQWSLVNVHRLF